VKCSDCGKDIRPVVAVDIDGTLADYHGHFIKFARNYLQRFPMGLREYDGTEKFRDWFCREYQARLDQWYDIKLAYRQGGMKRSQPVIGEAVRFVRNLRAYGAEVWLTTTRPYLRLDNIDPDTRFWLQSNGIQYDGLLYDEDKYVRLFANVGDLTRVVAIVDDLAEQYDAAEAIFGKEVPILRKTQYNRNVHRRNEVDHLNTALAIIEPRVRTWGKVAA
jgi:hypothetical protein